MKKRRYLALFLRLVISPCFLYAQGTGSNPNIIYILADDMGIGDLSIYNENGKIHTPNLDAMARKGMRSTDAHTSSSVCTPTRYGILTGRYNWRTPLKEFVLWGNSPVLIRENRLTVAKMLQESGYKTANIGKWHLGLNWAMKDESTEFEHFSKRTDRVSMDKIDYTRPVHKGALDLGFDYSFMIAASLNMPPFVYMENDKPTMVPTKITERKRTTPPNPTWIKRAISDDFKHEEVLPVFMDKAISYIKENANTEKPFFVYLPLAAPHNPILPIGKWKGKSEINPYADFVIMIDDLMGRIFETIEAQGIEENTLVIFTSDNGCSNQADIPMLQKNGHYPSYIYKGLKGSYFEGGHRVPFLVKWPKVIKPNSISDATICTTDFIATCVDIIGYTFNEAEAEDSFSMLPLLTEQGAYKREATVHHSKSGIFAIWKGDWKLIVSPNSGLNAADKKEKIRKVLPDNMLYNLNADPKEQNNLALEHPEKVKELRQLLIKYVLDGRSTPGRIQKNDSIFFLWPQIEFSADVTQDE